jgi:hypothetical protein
MNAFPPDFAMEHFSEDRPKIRELLELRTRALALRAGRVPPYISQLDYEQAKRELTGESELERQDAVIALLEAGAGESSPSV